MRSFFWEFRYFIFFSVEAFYCQVQSREKCFNLPRVNSETILAVTVLIPSYGLLTQKIPKCFVFAVSHSSAVWCAGTAGGSQQHIKPFQNMLYWSQTWESDFRERFSGGSILFHDLETVGMVGPYVPNIINITEAFLWMQITRIFTCSLMQKCTIWVWCCDSM